MLPVILGLVAVVLVVLVVVALGIRSKARAEDAGQPAARRRPDAGGEPQRRGPGDPGREAPRGGRQPARPSGKAKQGPRGRRGVDEWGDTDDYDADYWERLAADEGGFGGALATKRGASRPAAPEGESDSPRADSPRADSPAPRSTGSRSSRRRRAENADADATATMAAQPAAKPVTDPVHSVRSSSFDAPSAFDAPPAGAGAGSRGKPADKSPAYDAADSKTVSFALPGRDTVPAAPAPSAAPADPLASPSLGAGNRVAGRDGAARADLLTDPFAAQSNDPLATRPSGDSYGSRTGTDPFARPSAGSTGSTGSTGDSWGRGSSDGLSGPLPGGRYGDDPLLGGSRRDYADPLGAPAGSASTSSSASGDSASGSGSWPAWSPDPGTPAPGSSGSSGSSGSPGSSGSSWPGEGGAPYTSWPDSSPSAWPDSGGPSYEMPSSYETPSPFGGYPEYPASGGSSSYEVGSGWAAMDDAPSSPGYDRGGYSGSYELPVPGSGGSSAPDYGTPSYDPPGSPWSEGRESSPGTDPWASSSYPEEYDPAAPTGKHGGRGRHGQTDQDYPDYYR
ncbi:hypothetical protein [Bailinhaonella thermotolerans]|uniref:Uncharacterized protein n=1 Tax=Bailinhaonella thermotolerans TaxID=1070861 RepID=A0A3A4B7R3_9ACTN|nr:hypothetical protein [Bailinhaonella thermotolerans]RJL34271.1 hypothetical protein D5H75_07375 [Bailinhaonella thermotolerans]